MITVEEAKSKLFALDVPTRFEQKYVGKTVGQVLAIDTTSPIHMPPFSQSAMDGYAVRSELITAGSEYTVLGEVAAGSSNIFELREGEAVRIFTGAMVPESATAVVQQEWVESKGNTITIERDVAANMHIRFAGEQMKKGDVALKKGTLITPAGIGFLAMLGITSVEVFSKPKVTVLVTGNELVDSGCQLKPGQIYESNSVMLITALRKEGIEATSERIPDDLQQTIDRISAALKVNDILIITGGISVGDHDHVGTALNKLNVDEVFYKVAQKPGKPIFFGAQDKKAVFALPGNPAASLSCFYEYVIPVLRKAAGRTDTSLTSVSLPLATGTIRSVNRAQFLKARVENNQVSILNAQSSAMLSSFALANAQVYVPSNSKEFQAGELVEVHLLP